MVITIKQREDQIYDEVINSFYFREVNGQVEISGHSEYIFDITEDPGRATIRLTKEEAKEIMDMLKSCYGDLHDE